MGNRTGIRRSKYVSAFKYNPDLKERFFEQLQNNNSEETAKQYEKLIRKAGVYENYFEKDLYDFNLEELTEMLGSFGAKSKKSLDSQKPAFKLYIDYAMEEGYLPKRVGMMNIMDEVKIESLLNKKAIEEKKINRKQLYRLAKKFTNKQDIVAALLLFEGIKGNLCEDLLSIKVSDIDIVNKIVKVKNRIYNLPDEIIPYIMGAIAETNYYTNNGNSVDVEKQPLVQSDFLFRPLNRKREEYIDKLFYNGLVNRFKIIKEVSKNRYITPGSLYESGIAEKIYLYANEILKKESREVTKKEMAVHIKELYPELTDPQIIRLLSIYFVDMDVAASGIPTHATDNQAEK